MNTEKRLILFIFCTALYFFLIPHVLNFFGWAPQPRSRKPPAVAAQGKEATGAGEQAVVKGGEKAGEAGAAAVRAPVAAEPPRPKVAMVDPRELVLGDVHDTRPDGYRLEVKLDQLGAGIDSVRSSRYEDDFGEEKRIHRPLELIRPIPGVPPSLALTFKQIPSPGAGAESTLGEEASRTPEAEDTLDSVPWEVVRDAQGAIKRQMAQNDPVTGQAVQGEEIVFQATSGQGVRISKAFRLWQGRDAVELAITLESPGKPRTAVYNLIGPHGIKIEGEWYTSTFRDLVFGQMTSSGTEVATYSAADVVGASKPVENTTLPLRFAGVENQYFATLLVPDPPPPRPEARWDDKTIAVVLRKDSEYTYKSEIGVRLSSRPLTIEPDQPVTHLYQVYAGPKTSEALAPYGADGLASYRKSSIIPFAATIARVFITPTLSVMYQITEKVAHWFGGKRGNYGVAIIMLTILVRALMFPIGRKQALAAQKTQKLQPLVKELQEKYKDDQAAFAREHWALLNKHGANPIAGCLPALIQLPIFVGLWQALNTSFFLRHASFLWIQDLAAPDMLFRLPFDLPTFGGWINLGNWFNVLPFIVVGLMLVQTKLFSPPPSTPEAEQQQKVMKVMMVVMGVMFYKVPSGLGIYFITSSLWAIGERLLLPKITHAAEPVAVGSGEPAGKLAGAGKPAKPPGKLARFWERVLEEAQKNSTHRNNNMVEAAPGELGRSRPRSHPRGRGR